MEGEFPLSHYSIVLSQGKLIHKDWLLFPYEERALQFGDGVYEVIRIYRGNVYLLEEHIARLYRSLDSVSISIKETPEQMSQLLHKLVEKNEVNTDSFIYLQISRGSAERNHPFPKGIEPNIYAYIQNRPRPINEVTNGVNTITLPDDRWKKCHIKSLNLLPNILAKQAAIENNCYEAIFLDDDTVTECSSSNIFLVKNEVIYTHPPTNRILRGCVRDKVIGLAESLSMKVVEEAFTKKDLYEADELFLTSSISEIIPIVSVDERDVDSRKPGVFTKQLQQAYEKDAQISV